MALLDGFVAVEHILHYGDTREHRAREGDYGDGIRLWGDGEFVYSTGT